MTMHAHKVRLGIFLVSIHFIVLLSVGVFWVAGGFLFDEMIAAVGLIAPLFAGYTTVIISYINDHKNTEPPPEPVTHAYRISSLLIALLFGIVVEGAVTL